MMKVSFLLRKPVIALAIFVLMYFMHSALEHQLYKQCKANIIRVMLYSKSDMCMQLERILTTIECMCSKDVFGIVNMVTSYGGSLLGGMLF